MSANLPWTDLLLAAVCLLSVAIGLVRGLVFEVMSLVGWLVAYFAATTLSPALAPHLPVGALGSPLRNTASFAAAFIATLLIWAILTRLLRMLIQASPLSLFDRLLGGVFGGLRGVLLLLLAALVVNATPAAKSVAWRESRLVPWLDSALAALKPVILPQLSKHLPSTSASAGRGGERS